MQESNGVLTAQLSEIFKDFLYVCIFGCAESLLLRGFFSSCSTQPCHCGGFSYFGAQALGLTGFSTCCMQAQSLWLLGSRSQA